MKIDSIPKDLDVILRFRDTNVVLSNSPSYSTPSINVDKNVGTVIFLTTTCQNTKNVTFKSYEFKVTAGVGIVQEKSTLEIFTTEDGLDFKINSKPAKFPDLAPFLRLDEYAIVRAFEHISFNSHIGRIGYNDIFLELKSVYSSYRYRNTADAIRYFTYFSDSKMYAIAEKLIKMGMKESVSNYNPAVSGKEIPDVSTVKPLSKISISVLNDIKGRVNDATALLSDLEANSNVGVNGVKMIEEMCALYDSLEDRRYDECESFRVGWTKGDLYEGIHEIVSQFNISIKVLINRIIKASFTENLAPRDFVKLASDYIIMSRAMGLAIPEKMPKDIVKDHDLISAQFRYVQDKLIEKQFKANVAKNKLLLTKLPENKYFTIISPETPNDLIEEGLIMHHCVGTYVNRYAAGGSKIFFVRRKDAIDEPFVTLEVNAKNRLIQAKAYANSNPAAEVMEFIHEWLLTLE